MDTVHPDADWQFIRQFLPSNLSELAKSTAAVRRWRNISGGDELLRLCLSYAVDDLSLRSAAGWSTRADLAALKDTSVLYRLRQAAPFLEAVLAHLINHRVFAEKADGSPVRLVDATVLSAPGSTGTDWRLHAVYDPASCRLLRCEITDKHGGERLDRHQYEAGNLVVGDRGLAHARGIHAVHDAGAHSLLRMHWQNIRLVGLEGEALELDSILSRADAGMTGTLVSVPVPRGEPDRPAVRSRLIMRQLPPGRVAEAVQRAKRNARKKNREPDPTALKLAAYLSVLTTIPEAVATDAAVLEYYRVRWQIELFFKRCKTILRLDRLRAFAPDLVRTYLLTKLIEVALIELLATEGEAFSPWGYPQCRSSVPTDLAHCAPTSG